MQSVSADYLAKLRSGSFGVRYFLWLTAFDRSTGVEEGDGMWTGDGSTDADIYNPDIAANETRTFKGIGRAMAVATISKVADMTIQKATIDLSAATPEVNDLIRAYDLRFGRCEVYRGLVHPDSGEMVAPAEPRFLGFVTEAPVVLPAEGGEGSAKIVAVSQSHEFTRSNPVRRSEESQQRRLSSDTFYRRANAAAVVRVFWGRKAS